MSVRWTNNVLLQRLMVAWSLFLQIADFKEYCQFETFNASCAASQVIVLEEAKYGRLQLGRCVTRDYGYIGCSANVLDVLDRTCSGQRWCQFGIPTLRDLVQPCPKDLTVYLEATYRCITVFKTSHLRCNDTIQVDNATPSIYISIAAAPWDPGTASVASALPQPTAVPFSSSCPLQFKTGPGQRINFTLFSLGHYYDFVEPTDVVDTWDPKSCPANVFITDAGRKYTSSLCRAHQREQHLYTTNASLTSLHFSKLQRMQTSIARKTTYILKVEAVGCPDIRPTGNAWVERFNDRLMVKCNRSQETWYLTCSGRTWVGNIANCTHGALPVNGSKIHPSRKAMPFGLFVAIVVGIMLGVIFGGVMLVTVFVYRRRQKRGFASKFNTLAFHEESASKVEESYSHVYRTACPVHALILPGSSEYPPYVTPPPPPPPSLLASLQGHSPLQPPEHQKASQMLGLHQLREEFDGSYNSAWPMSNRTGSANESTEFHVGEICETPKTNRYATGRQCQTHEQSHHVAAIDAALHSRFEGTYSAQHVSSNNNFSCDTSISSISRSTEEADKIKPDLVKSRGVVDSEDQGKISTDQSIDSVSKTS